MADARRREEDGSPDLSPIEVGEGEPGNYKPVTSTWGVFERPANISKAYGGGRNIPYGGEKGESEEQQEKRRQTLEKVKKYKQSLLEKMDEGVVGEIRTKIRQGNDLMGRGMLTSAEKVYEEACELAPQKTTVGGEARLQRAICLDSQGKHGEAMEIYKELKGHRDVFIAKQAANFLFGFTAMDTLQTHELDYRRRGAFKPYFEEISLGVASDYATMVPSSEKEGEDEGRSTRDLGLAVAVTLGFPLIILVTLAMRHS